MKFKKTKQIIIKIDDFREEKLETFIANRFKQYDELENADEIRTKLNYTIMDTMQALTTQYGSGAITPEIKSKINKVVLKIEKAANKKIQNQLNKKSKAYQNRHKELV
jgi:hypothetical protein